MKRDKVTFQEVTFVSNGEAPAVERVTGTTTVSVERAKRPRVGRRILRHMLRELREVSG